MRLSVVKEVAFIRSNSKIIYLDEKTEISWIPQGSCFVVSNPEKPVKKSGESVFINTFIKNNTIHIQKYVLKKDHVLVIRGIDKDFVFMVSMKPVNNPNPFKFPNDMKSFSSKKKDKASDQQ